MVALQAITQHPLLREEDFCVLLPCSLYQLPLSLIAPQSAMTPRPFLNQKYQSTQRGPKMFLPVATHSPSLSSGTKAQVPKLAEDRFAPGRGQ